MNTPPQPWQLDEAMTETAERSARTAELAARVRYLEGLKMPHQPPDKVRTWILAVIAAGVIGNLFYMVRLDNRQEHFLDVGVFQGRYESEQKILFKEIERLTGELETERAWKTSVKTNLGELLALLREERQKQLVAKMIDERRSP